ncbi:MAG: hypothetical protein QOF98_1142 [Streptomyces sp.]|nr:hypothetical protein [Streptomyces sp.]
MKPIPLLLGGLAAGGGLLLAGTLRWRAGTAALVARMREPSADLPLPPFAAADLEGLPAPVARYLRAVLPDAVPAITYARLAQRGDFLVRPRPDGWRPFTAVEHFSARPPGFVWDARIRMAPGMSVLVRDAFAGGQGSMVASVMGVRRIVSVSGTPAITTAAMQRYLAEAVWLPTALLPGAGVAWSALGPDSARASLTAGAVTASLDFFFGADGLVERIYTAARERDLGSGRTAPTPWQGRFSRYEAHEGYRIPMAGEVEWLLAEGPRPYWRGEITGVTFELDHLPIPPAIPEPCVRDPVA